MTSSCSHKAKGQSHARPSGRGWNSREGERAIIGLYSSAMAASSAREGRSDDIFK